MSNNIKKEQISLVTGATGYVATHLVRQLLEEGYKVRGTVRSLQNEAKVAPLRNLCPGAKFPLELVEADLMDEECWERVVEGCSYVYHTASPFPTFTDTPGQEVIDAAVKGTTHVLNACVKHKVKRVVLTSSIVAVAGGAEVPTNRPITEKDWTEVDDNMVYVKSKTLAEKTAWEIVADASESQDLEMAVVNPGLVLGPPLCGGGATSIDFMVGLLSGVMPMAPAIFMGVCDIQDVAKAHIKAMTTPKAAGQRHLIITDAVWTLDVSKILADEFQSQGYNLPLAEAPNAGGPFSQAWTAKTDRMRNILKIKPRPLKETVIEMAYSLIEQGKVAKTEQYQGPSVPANDASN